MDKNLELIASFKRYCITHPEERFWQALRNWAGVNYVLICKGLEMSEGKFEDLEDTYYWEGKNK